MPKRRKKGTGSVKVQREYERDPSGAYLKDGGGKPIVKREFYRGMWSGEDCYGVTHRLAVQAERERPCHKLLDEALEKKQAELDSLKSKKWFEEREEAVASRIGTVEGRRVNPFADRLPTISTFIQECYWDSNYASRQSHGTQANLKGYVANHLNVRYAPDKPPLGDITMTELTSKHLMDFEQSKLKSLSSKTRLHIINFLRGVYALARSSEWCNFTGVQFNVPQEYRPLRHNDLDVEVPKQALPIQAMRKIQSEAESAGDHTMVNLILFALYGVRPNAAASLSWKDFDEETKTFSIARQLKTENGERTWRPTKNRRGYLLPVLPEHIGLMKRTAEYSEFVCPASRKYRNQPIRHTAWGERFKVYATKAGYPLAVLYDAKSSIATAARESNMDTAWIAKALAVTPEMIDRHYHKQTIDGVRAFYAQLLGSPPSEKE